MCPADFESAVVLGAFVFRLGVAASKFIAASGSLAELPALDAAALPAAGAPAAGAGGGDKAAKSSEERSGAPVVIAGTCVIAAGRVAGGKVETGFAAA